MCTAKQVNKVLMNKRGGAHDMKAGTKHAKRAKQNSTFRREMKSMM